MTQRTRKSLLAGTSWKTESDNRRAASLAEAEQSRDQAMTDLVVTIDDMSEAIAEQHPKPVDALSAEAAFLNQLRDTLVVSGDRITAFFANGYQQTGADQAQVHELSSRNQELEQELRAVQGNQDDLERSAQRASDLQLRVNELEREQRRLENEVATLTDENVQLHSKLEAEKADHQEAVNALRRAVSEKDAAVESSDAWQSRSEAVEQQLNDANARITDLQRREDRALDAGMHWRGIAVSLGYVEPDGSDQPDEPRGSDDASTGDNPEVDPIPGTRFGRTPDGGTRRVIGHDEPISSTSGDEQPTRLIDPENGTFSGDQSSAPAADESQPRRRRLSRPARQSRRSGSRTVPEQHRPDEGA